MLPGYIKHPYGPWHELAGEHPNPEIAKYGECVEAGELRANQYGFTSALFEGYLWFFEENELFNPLPKQVYIPLIISKFPNAGAFSNLVRNLLDDGYMVMVPNPMMEMLNILKRLGFMCHGKFPNNDPEIWSKRPGSTHPSPYQREQDAEA